VVHNFQTEIQKEKYKDFTPHRAMYSTQSTEQFNYAL
jgi:hypothetical protein